MRTSPARLRDGLPWKWSEQKSSQFWEVRTSHLLFIKSWLFIDIATFFLEQVGLWSNLLHETHTVRQSYFQKRGALQGNLDTTKGSIRGWIPLWPGHRHMHFWKRKWSSSDTVRKPSQSNHLQALSTTTHCEKYISLPDHTRIHKKPKTRFCWTTFLLTLYPICYSFLLHQHFSQLGPTNDLRPLA